MKIKAFSLFILFFVNSCLFSKNNFQEVKRFRGKFLTWEDEEFSNKDTFYQYLKRCLDYQNNPQKIKVHNASFNIVSAFWPLDAKYLAPH